MEQNILRSGVGKSFLILVAAGLVVGIFQSRKITDQMILIKQKSRLSRDLMQYKTICGHFPGNEGSVSVLLQKDESCPRWTIPDKIPSLDPWGHEYKFKIVEGKAVVSSTD